MYNQQQPDFQHLGVYGIFKESLKLIFKHHKIFKNITVTLILPQILPSLAILIFLPSNSTPNISTFLTPSPSPYNSSYYNSSFQWNAHWLIYAMYRLFSIVLSLVSVSVVTYTVVCIYTDKDITFKNVIRVVSKAWKRLIVTYLCLVLAMFGYNLALVLVILLLVVEGGFFIDFSYKFGGGDVGLLSIFGIMVAVILLLMIVYMGIIWQFAKIISVLETTSGFQAMAKSKKLIKGKMGIAIGIYLVLIVCLVPDYLLMKHLKMKDGKVEVVFGENILFMIITVVWLTFQSLLSLVVQTVLYLVCKSCDGENIEKDLALDDDIEEGYYVEYEPLNSKLAEIGETNNIV